ncbi:MAG: tRNA (adenine(22)-N(1))-methyltransferase TrmK [bacterium]|nr:tRNA (adenine(22)-N(1))-methyltransferase TrmK [bacterium]
MDPSPVEPVTRRLGITSRIRALVAHVPGEADWLIDVGTNHGILPIAALRAGCAARCVAIDKSRTALAETRRRLRRSGCLDRVRLVCADTLAAVELPAPEHRVVVCLAGLGPRTIVDLLASGLPRIAARPTRLLLNPLVSSAGPRRFLREHGFDLVADETVADRGREYELLVAEAG